MSLLENYLKEKNTLLYQYDAILKSGILPVDDITEDAVRKRKEKLESERFTVAVCGQIKAGKSTLLNSLVFGKIVLPYDDTPLTAKLTFIKHGTEPQANVCFYNSVEWKNIKADYANDKDLNEQFEASIEIALQNGVYEVECIRDISLQKTIGLVELLSYVAAPIKDRNQGKYTPFVKNITITYDMPRLKDVTIVDTPGINDPSKLNSDTTEKWINQSDAVIYVAYAGRALDSIDVDFINNMLQGVSPSHRLVVINKCDVSEEKDVQDIRVWAAQLEHSEDACVRNVFSHHGEFHYVSALGGLISNLQEQNIELDQELEYYRDNLLAKGYLSQKGSGIEELFHAIEQRLMNNRGEGLLKASRTFQAGIFKKAERNYEIEIETIHEESKTLKLSGAQLLKEKDSLLKKKQDLRLFDEKVNTEWAKVLDTAEVKMSDSLKTTKREMKADALRMLSNKYKNMKDKALSIEMSWIAKDILEQRSDDFQIAVNKAAETLSGHCEDLQAEMRNFLLKDFDVSLNMANTLIFLPVSKLINEVERLPDKKLTEERIKNIIKEKRGFWEKIKGRRKEGGELDTAFQAALKECIESACDTFRRSILEDGLRPRAQEVISDLQTDINLLMEQRQKTIEEMLTDETDIKLKRERIQEKLNSAEDALKSLRNWKEGILT